MILDQICRGEATMEDLDQLERLAGIIAKTALCGLGQGAPNPIFSTLRYFRDEYIAHIVDKVCPAGVCTITPAEVKS
jgi:NADH-quinone oxidoreductase subunit F/NADP-reducing hydrogenase subunit HndC